MAKLPPLPEIVPAAWMPPDTIALMNIKQERPLTEAERDSLSGYGPPLPEDERLALIESAFTVSGAVIRGVRTPRADCTFPGCQLSLGHPPPHCVADPDGADQYLMIDADGSVLRSL